MSFGISTRINSGCKIFLSVQQWTRSTVVRNEKYLICRDYNAFSKSPEFFPSPKDSQTTIKNHAVCNEVWRSSIFIKHQCLISSGCKAYSDKCVLPNSQENNKNEKKKVSVVQKVKQLFKDYWYIIGPVHLVTSCVWFGSYYYIAASGIDIPALLEYIGAPESVIQSLNNSQAGNIFIAYTLYKISTPLRYTVTAGASTFVINYCKKVGWISTAAKAEVPKETNKDKKGILDNLRAISKDKMQVTKNEFLKTKNKMQNHLNEVLQVLNKSVSESRQDFKEGVQNGADEWKMIFGGAKKNFLKLKEGLNGGKTNK